MLKLISNLNAKNNTLNMIIKLRENIHYIKKFELALNITQYINF